MTGAEVVTRRRGGRSARRELRAAPIPEAERAVKPGMEGGRYKPLTDAEVEKIHRAALDLLETVGLADAIPSCVEMVTAAGGKLSEEGRLIFPRTLVEDTLANCARHFPIHGRDPKHDLEPWGKKVYFGTAGAAVHMVDAMTGEYRESTSLDLYDIARVVDRMDNIHFFQRSIVCRDLEDPREMDLNTCYAAISGTAKHVGTSFVLPEHAAESLEMLHYVAGGEKQWRERPFVSLSCCHVVPPMKFAEDACRALEVCVRGGMPVLLLSAGQAGATSPAALAGSIVQEVAEVLAGLVYVNLIVPGHPAIMGTWPFVSDLRTGAMSGGSGEQALLSAACAQMAHFYDLSGGVPAGMTDSKVPDAQAGLEKGYTQALAGLAGANMIYESAGMHASLLGFCLESLVIDNDTIGAVLRGVRGIEVTDESLSVETIRQVCMEGPGHFLGHEQTLGLMQAEYVYPEVGDRSSPKEWVEQGSTDVRQKARAQVKAILAEHYPDYITPDQDAAIRERFPVRIARDNMRLGNDRW
ncbi:MAG: trimethylamine methyltransferase family protein [Kiloniellales bacterium]|nr:trimethylamine methyltransferase family protein [Kiloniellales bacterium]